MSFQLIEKAVAHSVLCYGDALAQSLAYPSNNSTGTIPTTKFLVSVMEKHMKGWKMISYQVTGKYKLMGDDKDVKETRETQEGQEE